MADVTVSGSPHFADLLRSYRRDQGLTQEALAELAGLSARGIRALEHGERSAPHRDTLDLLANALKLSPGDKDLFEAAARQSSSVEAGTTLDVPSGGYLGARPIGPLVGRQTELDRALNVVDEVEREGRLVMLAGEPGVGKTRLAQEVMVELEERGFLIATGRCYESEQSTAYYPFVEALTTAYAVAPPNIQNDVPRHWPYVERLLSNRPFSQSAEELGGHDAQQRLFWAATQFVGAISDVQPLAVLLDDLHWADESSLKLLQYLARASRSRRILVIGTYRDVDINRSHPLERVLLDLNREGLLNEIIIRRLSREGTAALAMASFRSVQISDDFLTLLHSRTDGNPFFTQEVLRALAERGDLLAQEDGESSSLDLAIEVPRSIRSAIGQRVTRLSGPAQKLLNEASVLGEAFTIPDLCAMSGEPEDRVEEAMDEAVAADLIRVAGKDRISFNHALTQQTLHAELASWKCIRLHLAAAKALERLPEDQGRSRAAEIAGHFLQADEVAEALPYSMMAGDQAESVFAPAEALQQYETALDLASLTNDPHAQAKALEKIGILLRVLNRETPPWPALDRAAALYEDAGDYEGLARTTHQIALAHYYLGSPEQGIERAQRLADRLDALSHVVVTPEAMADLYTGLAICLWPLARYSEMLAAAERAANVALTARSRRTLPVAETEVGMAMTMISPLPDARRLLGKAIASFEQTDEHWWQGQPWGSTGRTFLDEGDLENALRCLEKSRRLIDSEHIESESAWIRGCIAEVYFVHGRWKDAETAYEIALQIARGAGVDRFLCYILLHLAEIHASVGDWERAGEEVREGIEVATRCAAVDGLRKAQRLLSERDAMDGRPQVAIDRLEPLLATAMGQWPRAFPPPVLAEAYLAVGDGPKAEELVERRVTQFRLHKHRRALALWLRVQGMVFCRQGQYDRAEDALDKAVTLAAVIPYPYAQALALHELGRLNAGRHAFDQALLNLNEAHAIFGHLGAVNYRDLVLHAISELPNS